MKSKISMLCSIALIAIMPSVATSAEIEVSLKEPNKFVDIRLSGKSRNQSKKIIKKDLVKLFSSLSKDILKEGQTLKVEVSNLDLPGHIDYARAGFNQEMRLVKYPDFYRIEFSYELVDKSGTSIKSGNEKLKGFVENRPTRKRSNKYGSLDHFAGDIEEWLKSTFSS